MVSATLELEYATLDDSAVMITVALAFFKPVRALAIIMNVELVAVRISSNLKL